MTDLIRYINTAASAVCSQAQVESIYFDVSQTFDKVPHYILLIKVTILDSVQNVICFYISVSSVAASVCTCVCVGVGVVQKCCFESYIISVFRQVLLFV